MYQTERMPAIALSRSDSAVCMTRLAMRPAKSFWKKLQLWRTTCQWLCQRIKVVVPGITPFRRTATSSSTARGLTINTTAIMPTRSGQRAGLRPDRGRGDPCGRLLCLRERLRPRLGELAGNLFHRSVELGQRHALVHEAEALRLRRAQAFARQHVAPRLRLAERARDVRADHRGHQADSHFGQAELGLLGGDDQVARRNEPHAARERGALHARDDRLGTMVHRVQKRSEAPSLAPVARPGHLCSLLLPVQISTRAQVLAPARLNANP